MKHEETELRRSMLINAKRAKVFAAWTTAEIVMQWFAPGDMTVPHAEVDARVGGKYLIKMQSSDGKIQATTGIFQEIVPDQKLVFTWGWEGPRREETWVTVDFSDQEDGTLVTITHTRFKDAEQTKMHAQGWEGCLANLAKRIANA